MRSLTASVLHRLHFLFPLSHGGGTSGGWQAWHGDIGASSIGSCFFQDRVWGNHYIQSLCMQWSPILNMTHRNKDAPLLLSQTVSRGDHSVAACPANLELLCSQDVGFHCAQTSPTSCANAYRTLVHQATRIQQSLNQPSQNVSVSWVWLYLVFVNVVI